MDHDTPNKALSIIEQGRILEFVDDGDFDPYKEALIFLCKHPDNEIMKRILRSSNPSIAGDGLFLLSELGPRGAPLLDAALTHCKHPSWTSRFYLVDAAIASSSSLSASQTGKLLPLASDENSNVREKVIHLISYLSADHLKQSIATMDQSEHVDEHLKGLKYSTEAHLSPDDKFQLAQSLSGIAALYCFAAVIAAARDGAKVDRSITGNKTPELEYTLWRLSRL